MTAGSPNAPLSQGTPTSAEDEERRLLEEDLASARTREEKSRAARNNALERGYMRPDLAGPSINRFYKNHGIDALRDRFADKTSPSLFGVKRGNPFTQEGRATRADANEARRDLPDLWDSHAQDRKNRDAAERAFAERYGIPREQSDGLAWPEVALNDRQGMAVHLDLLVDVFDSLDESIKQIDSQIEHALQDLAAGRGDVAKTLEIIAERRRTQLERMFELGETHAQIDELENRIQEHDAREENRQAEQQHELPAAEDHLDWLRPTLEGQEPEPISEDREPHRKGLEPEDYLDWWKR